MCIVLVLVAVRFGFWTMMAELFFSVDDFIRAKRVSNCYIPKKKSARVRVCSTNLGFSVGYVLCTTYVRTWYQHVCTWYQPATQIRI